MFWGLVLEPGKRYSTTVEKSFHVSKAALDCTSVRNESDILSVMLETEGSEALLCNLCKQKGILQEDLDLNFMAGDRLTFECRGHGRIHLSGYLLPDEEDDLSGMLGDEEESEEEEEDTTEWSGTSSSPEKQKKEKRKQDAPPGGPAKKKKLAADDEEGDSDSDQDDESDLSEGMDDEDVEDEEDDEDDEMNDKEEDESEDEEETVVNTKEKQKQQKQEKNKTPNKQNVNTPKKTPVANGVTPKEQKSNKKTPGGGEKSPNTTPRHKHLLDHGVVVKELRIGNGVPAKIGKAVSVYYVGRLKDGNKVFDKLMKGEGFKFKLGKGEVIKGWDIGVQGMKVGGKRVIQCPPEAAYGAKGVPPKIPPNSTLIFEVELKNVH